MYCTMFHLAEIIVQFIHWLLISFTARCAQPLAWWSYVTKRTAQGELFFVFASIISKRMNTGKLCFSLFLFFFFRVYCTACMKHLLCPTTYDQVLQEDPWECFLCATNNKPRPSFDSIIKPRANWKDKMINMFRTKSNPQQLVKRNREKKKIRVLSLFDGLGTGAALRFYSFFSAKKLGTWSNHGLPIFC